MNLIPEESVIEEETKSMAPTDYLDNMSDQCPSEEAPNRFDVIDLSLEDSPYQESVK